MGKGSVRAAVREAAKARRGEPPEVVCLVGVGPRRKRQQDAIDAIVTDMAAHGYRHETTEVTNGFGGTHRLRFVRAVA